jgi:D-xylulose reductase
MQAVVLTPDRKLHIRDIAIDEPFGPHDVRIALHSVGICSSDVHYYTHGRIGPFVVEAPMVLGHEASGTILEVGGEVRHLKVGDRVCMEPGIPDPNSRASRLGLYNLDPAVRFWATPPYHGVLRPTVVHPGAYTFKLPDTVSHAEGAMVEPLAVGMHAASKAQITPGDVAAVIGAGTIGLVTALAALAGGCSRAIMIDVKEPKLELAARLGPITPVNATTRDPAAAVNEMTDGWGADIVFEASGDAAAAARVFEMVCPGGCVVLIGMPLERILYDVVAAQAKEARVDHVFRYAHVYPRALALMASGRIDLKPLITDIFPFKESLKAFDFALAMPPRSVKVQIEVKEP